MSALQELYAKKDEETTDLEFAVIVLDTIKHDEAVNAAEELKRLQAVKSELLRLIDASAEFDSVTTFNRDDEDNELCAYCLTNPGEPHKKGCRAVDAHKAFLQAVSSAREVLRGEQ